MTRFFASAPQMWVQLWLGHGCGFYWFERATMSSDEIKKFPPLSLPNPYPIVAAKLDRFSALLRAYRRGMAAAEKTSFLGSLSPWALPRNPSPNPLARGASDSYIANASKDENKQVDHSISLRPSPSLRQYPKDCPPLNTRWFYATDAPKRKPFASDSVKLPAPKKFFPFSIKDSQAIESTFQALGTGGGTNLDGKSGSST
jgi:hypothetical protein